MMGYSPIHHRRVSMTQIDALPNLTLPYGPSLDVSPPTRSPTLSCTTVCRPPTGPSTGQAKGKTRHCRTQMTKLGCQPADSESTGQLYLSLPPPTGQAKDMIHHCQVRTTQLDAHLGLTLLY